MKLFLCFTLLYATSNMLKIINLYRRMHNLNELKVIEPLKLASELQANTMCKENKLTHKNPLPNKKTLGKRLEFFNFKGSNIGENIAKQQNNDFKEVFKVWNQSPLHRKNILGDYTYTGISSCVGQDKNRYWVQVFGKGYVNWKGSKYCKEEDPRRDNESNNLDRSNINLDRDEINLDRSKFDPDRDEINLERGNINLDRDNENINMDNPTADENIIFLLKDTEDIGKIKQKIPKNFQLYYKGSYKKYVAVDPEENKRGTGEARQKGNEDPYSRDKYILEFENKPPGSHEPRNTLPGSHEPRNTLPGSHEPPKMPPKSNELSNSKMPPKSNELSNSNDLLNSLPESHEPSPKPPASHETPNTLPNITGENLDPITGNQNSKPAENMDKLLSLNFNTKPPENYQDILQNILNKLDRLEKENCLGKKDCPEINRGKSDKKKKNTLRDEDKKDKKKDKKDEIKDKEDEKNKDDKKKDDKKKDYKNEDLKKDEDEDKKKQDVKIKEEKKKAKEGKKKAEENEKKAEENEKKEDKNKEDNKSNPLSSSISKATVTTTVLKTVYNYETTTPVKTVTKTKPESKAKGEADNELTMTVSIDKDGEVDNKTNIKKILTSLLKKDDDSSSLNDLFRDLIPAKTRSEVDIGDPEYQEI